MTEDIENTPEDVAVLDTALVPEVSLEAEGEIAADYVEELLDICDLDGDIDIEVKGERVYISITSEDQDSNVKVLADPDVVAALQELTRLAVQNKTGAFSRLILDVQNSRELRVTELRGKVMKALAKLEGGAEKISFEPMSSYERKLVHDLASENGMQSESEGQGRDRHVVLRLA